MEIGIVVLLVGESINCLKKIPTPRGGLQKYREILLCCGRGLGESTERGMVVKNMS